VTWLKVQLHILVSVQKWSGSSNPWPEAAVALEDYLVCNCILSHILHATMEQQSILNTVAE